MKGEQRLFNSGQCQLTARAYSYRLKREIRISSQPPSNPRRLSPAGSDRQLGRNSSLSPRGGGDPAPGKPRPVLQCACAEALTPTQATPPPGATAGLGGGAWAQDGRCAPGAPESELSGPGAEIPGASGPGAGEEGAWAGSSRREEGAGVGGARAGLRAGRGRYLALRPWGRCFSGWARGGA